MRNLCLCVMVLLWGCDGSVSGGVGATVTPVDERMGTNAGVVNADGGEGPAAPGEDGGTSSGGEDNPEPDAGPSATPPDAGVINCTETWNVPPANLRGWSPALSRSGADTLTHTRNHGHDDGFGPIGFCPAGAPSGTRYLALVSARFETDHSPPDFACATDFRASDATFAAFGMCFSGGRHHIFVEVRDENGNRVPAGFDVFWPGGSVSIGDQGKPAHEFPMNFAMYGGGARYRVRATWGNSPDGPLLSDQVTNLRLPGNHHVNYLLTFQVTRAP